jgi:RNA polymerase sigma-70 factor (ECF subfamily)
MAMTELLSTQAPVEELDDACLIAAFKEGSHAAFQVLVRRYEGRVFNLCLRMVNDEVESTDLTQEVFLKVYRSIGNYQHDYAFYTWVYRIAVNACIDYMRKRKRHGNTVSLCVAGREGEREAGREMDIPDASGIPDALLEQAQLRSMMMDAIGQLSDKLRTIILLKEVEGFTYEEIADVLGCSRGTVKSRLFRARERLRELLGPAVAAGDL